MRCSVCYFRSHLFLCVDLARCHAELLGAAQLSQAASQEVEDAWNRRLPCPPVTQQPSGLNRAGQLRNQYGAHHRFLKDER